jgi:hypothetical protein
MKPHYKWTPDGPVFLGWRLKGSIVIEPPAELWFSELQDATSWKVGGFEYLGMIH